MTPARIFTAAAVVCVVGFAARGQDENAPPGRHIVLSRQVEPDAVRKVGDWVKAANAMDRSGSLFQDALKLWQQAPSKDLKSIAEQLIRQHPELRDRGTAEALQKQFGRFQEDHGLTPQPPDGPPEAELPPGLPAAEPNARPPEPRPTRPPVEVPPEKPNPVAATPPAHRPPGSFHPRNNPSRHPDREPELGHRPPVEMPRHELPPFPGFDAWDDDDQRAQALAAERERRQRQFETIRGFWEKNFGDMNQTPAVRDMLKDMIAGPAPLDADAAEGLTSLLGDAQSDPAAFVKWATDQSSLFENADVPSLGFKLSDWSLPSLADDPGAPGGAGYPGLAGTPLTSEATWLPVVLFVAVAAGALFAWRFWPRSTPGAAGFRPRAVPGLGPWPVDPREIADRAALIRAFEYLSVLVCGSGARAWNHVTIADALRAAPGGADAAEPLARLYALARYAPAGLPLPPEALAEARKHLCRLAGVPAP